MPDYIFMLESRLLPDQLRILNQLQEEAQEAGLNLYLVGGAVRALLTGYTIQDLDFVFEGNPLRLVRRLSDPPPWRVTVNKVTHSAEMVLSTGVSLSLEMARNEVYQEPGKLPDIRPATILDDLRRRDFSINAMGISLAVGSRGLLLDPTNGLADIERRELRALHNYSFLHDPSRLLRLVRFSARLGFKPEERTQEQFELALERGYPAYIYGEQLSREMALITREENPVAVLKALHSHGLLEVFHPSLQRRKPDYERMAKYQRCRRQAEEAGYRFDVFPSVLYYILRRLSGADAKRLLRRLKLGTAEQKAVQKWIPDVKKTVTQIGRRRKPAPKQVYDQLSRLPLEHLVFALAEFSQKSAVQKRIQNYLYKYRPLRQTLPVQELESLGLPRGPKFDEVLEKYFELRISGKIRKSVSLLKYLRKLAGIPEPKPEPPAPKPAPAKAKAAIASGGRAAKKKPSATGKESDRKELLKKALARKKASPKKPVSKPVRAKARPGAARGKKKPAARKSRPKPQTKSKMKAKKSVRRKGRGRR